MGKSEQAAAMEKSEEAAEKKVQITRTTIVGEMVTRQTVLQSDTGTAFTNAGQDIDFEALARQGYVGLDALKAKRIEICVNDFLQNERFTTPGLTIREACAQMGISKIGRASCRERV